MGSATYHIIVANELDTLAELERRSQRASESSAEAAERLRQALAQNTADTQLTIGDTIAAASITCGGLHTLVADILPALVEDAQAFEVEQCVTLPSHPISFDLCAGDIDWTEVEALLGAGHKPYVLSGQIVFNPPMYDETEYVQGWSFEPDGYGGGMLVPATAEAAEIERRRQQDYRAAAELEGPPRVWAERIADRAAAEARTRLVAAMRGPQGVLGTPLEKLKPRIWEELTAERIVERSRERMVAAMRGPQVGPSLPSSSAYSVYNAPRPTQPCPPVDGHDVVRFLNDLLPGWETTRVDIGHSSFPVTLQIESRVTADFCHFIAAQLQRSAQPRTKPDLHIAIPALAALLHLDDRNTLDWLMAKVSAFRGISEHEISLEMLELLKP